MRSSGSTKKLWLFDSFQGLPKPTDKDVLINDISNAGSIEAYEGAMAVPVEEVQKRLSEIRFSSRKSEHCIRLRRRYFTFRGSAK